MPSIGQTYPMNGSIFLEISVNSHALHFGGTSLAMKIVNLTFFTVVATVNDRQPANAITLLKVIAYFRADFDEDAASLLYMSTGGGKTEAFFGTVVFGLFLDRLRGKRRGVTAMMHYPLRLLTVQQAQRLAKLLEIGRAHV